jgi:hypothetical protein
VTESELPFHLLSSTYTCDAAAVMIYFHFLAADRSVYYAFSFHQQHHMNDIETDRSTWPTPALKEGLAS